jgi:hypothetical protein
MPAAQRTTLELLAVLASSLDRVKDHIQQACQLTERLQYDYHANPLRLAIALIAATERWRELCAELEDASDEIGGAKFELDELEERLEQDDAPDPADAFDDPDEDTPERRPAAAVIPFRGA